MKAFGYENQQLTCDGVAIAEIAARFGTPFYLYSAAQFRENFRAYQTAFAPTEATICFAVKACSNIAILRLLQNEGAGADTVSGGEIRRSLLAGIDPAKIIFSGVGKTREEIAFALDSQVGQLNVESVEELKIINEIAAAKGLRARVSVRVNPDVDAGTHEKIATGRKSDKFGIPWSEAWASYQLAKNLSHLEVEGLAFHIGSQVTELSPFRNALTKAVELAQRLQKEGFGLRRIDIGGGLGIRYRDETPIPLSEYAGLVMSSVAPLGLNLFLEPGRSIAAPAGALIAQVQFHKQSEGKNFVILDAGMNDLARPAIYGAYDEIVPVRENPATEICDLVGPVCESADVLGTNRRLPRLESGDLVAILDAGAYGASMSSNYNSRPLPPEILIENKAARVIRERQRFEEMIALEKF
jgi:diaminopimelate decarboxylase